VKRLLKLAESWPDSTTDDVLQESTCKTARPLRPAEVDDLVAKYHAGTTVRELATQFGIHRATVGRYLKTRGIDTKPPALVASDVARATKLYREGWSLAKIAKHYGVSAHAVNDYLRVAGVELRGRYERVE